MSRQRSARLEGMRLSGSIPGVDERQGLIRSAGRPPTVVRFECSMVNFFVDAADLLGVPKSVAAIYGICFANAEPLCFSEIQARLEISTGSISQGLRVLREIGALKLSAHLGMSHSGARLAQRDSKRRDYYQPDLELRKLVARFIEQRLERQLDAGKAALQSIVKQVPDADASAKVLEARLKALQTWHEQAHAVLPLVRGFLKLG